jgi:hypothetical protein
VVAEIDAHRHQGNLSSTIRLFVLDQARANAGVSMGAVAPMPSAMHGG